MSRRVDIVLDEIIAAIDGVTEATAGKTQADFEANWLLQRGAERALEIISEAARHVPAELTDLAPETPWAAIRAMGNRLRHEYHRISSRIVWSAVQDDLPPLREAVLRLRARC